MTYSENANRHISNQESLRLQMDDKGDYYYTSYPPFSLYLVYALFESFHVNEGTLALRLLNLLWDFVSAILIYLILKLLLSARRDLLSLPAMIAFAVYIFTPETLWVQCDLYFCDVFAQTLFVAGLYLLLGRIKGEIQGKWWPVFVSLFTFVFVYTDWIGLMFACGVFVFGCLYRREPSLKWLRAAVVSGVAGALALTFWQYSLISGPRAFLEFAIQKFLYRSGFGHEVALQIHV